MDKEGEGVRCATVRQVEFVAHRVPHLPLQEGFEGEQALMGIKEVMSFLGCYFYQELGWVISMQVFKAFTHVERWSR
jgi:hypothetical protein